MSFAHRLLNLAHAIQDRVYLDAVPGLQEAIIADIRRRAMSHAIDEVDHRERWRRCPECGRRNPGVRKDERTRKHHCDQCWAALDPATIGHSEGAREG